MEDQRLREKIVEVLCEEWGRAHTGILHSEKIYERLVASRAGEEVPEGAINDLLTKLKLAGLIRAAGMHDSEAVRRHGNWAITGVDTDVLCEAFRLEEVSADKAYLSHKNLRALYRRAPYTHYNPGDPLPQQKCCAIISSE